MVGRLAQRVDRNPLRPPFPIDLQYAPWAIVADSRRSDTDAETAEVLSLLKRVAVALELKEYNVLQNNGARAGQTVFHAHVHLVPKPTAAAGLIVQVGLTRVDQTGLAKEIRHRLGAPRAAGESQAGG